MEGIEYLLLDLLFGGLTLWIASKLTAVSLSFVHIMIAVALSTVASAVPAIGWPLSFIVLFFLLKQFSDADIWPDIILLVLVSRLIGILAATAIAGL